MLSFVPTPIGNLGDITIRSLEKLSESEIVICEDTRVSKQLFSLFEERYPNLFQYKKRDFISLHHHNSENVIKNIDIEIFKKSVVYISDAGMPGISDPGVQLVNFAIEKSIEFEVLPGATAFTVASLLSGFADRKLLFWGFLPHKGKDREDELNSILSNNFTTILYESPHRIEKLVEELSQKEPNREIFLAKELTKRFEKRFWGKSSEIRELLKNSNLKGEWVVAIKSEQSENSGIPISKDDILNLNIAPKEKAKLLSKLSGAKVKDIYNSLILE